MDEPLTNLDFQLRARMRSESKRIQRELNITLFYVTSDQVEALSMGDRIAVLNEGQLQHIGTQGEAYGSPANLFVASFLGSTRMNFLKCAYNADTGALASAEDGWSIQAPKEMRARAQAGSDPGNLVLGIWPEDVEITPGSGDGDLEGQVYVIEPLGARNVYDVAVGPNLLKIKTWPTFVLNPGVQVSIRFDMTRAHLFDDATQRALTQFRIHLEECDEQEPRFHPRVGL